MRRRIAGTEPRQALVMAGCTCVAIVSSIAYYGLTGSPDVFGPAGEGTRVVARLPLAAAPHLAA